MGVDYAQLVPGQQVSSHTYRLDQEMVSNYLEAVGDRSRPTDGDGKPIVPPMAIAALSLRGIIEDLAIPGGTLHAGQELRFSGTVAPGESLACDGIVAQNSVRGEWRFLVVESRVYDDSGRGIMGGKSTIMIPASG